ncbi:serine/threonine protein kinase, negative regulator of sexual conjugation and meiosis [Suillus clintonianus]|uniref:serine/threonine protein kinase, negative regulator of sexual conjugation and meiosis n=1 Tax=Suillus clintonianus TaxID=1904413 RepID=UPI001B85C2E3|nr:serine/threonine protein kinase, negative regulator of sexual conjugation and meiosis [Suillus clintonianus]KAG2137035.1 serine/threonine protein kinase, negative regulator of sexual conjugation and meiosis [Suillus clintonianus]
MNCQQEVLPIPDLSGRWVGHGRFKLVELIGYGSSGIVYLAHDTQSDPWNPVYYAIKCLLNKELDRESLMWQKREIACHSLVSRSSSPNICKLHQIFEEGLYMYCVLDYCPGGDLFTAIRLRTYEGNVPLIKKAFIELIDGVFACHTAGVYHRDLKPENILCVESGLGIRIADFGLATTKLVNREFNVGSWDYMSPECNYAMGSPHYSSLHSDIWSLGVILVNMVLGRSPWGPAILSDPNFRRYAENPNYLFDVLPISRSFNEILKQIFHLRESARISLPKLREEILRLDTFYPSEAELCNDLANEREAIHNHARRVAPLTNRIFHMPGYQVDDWSFGFNGAPQPQWAYRSSAPAIKQPSDTAGIEGTSSHLRVYDDGRPWSRARLSRCSSSENEGPVTPETRPYEPMIDPSDMPGQKGAVHHSLPPPSYNHPSCLCGVRICLPSLSPKIGTNFFVSKIMDTGGIVQVASTF